MRLLVDTNVFVDYLAHREPFAQKSELLMIAGKVGEFELWISSSQVTDLLYILSNGGKKSLMPKVASAVDGLLDFVNVFTPGKAEIRVALRENWDDPEDALIHAVARRLEAQAIITRNVEDFEQSLISVFSAEDFFLDLKGKGITYDYVDIC